MVKAKLRVRRLTLPPSSHPSACINEEGSHHQSEEEGRILDKEKMARITELAMAASWRNCPRPHRHGVEPEFGKFWAKEDDGDSSSESEEEPDDASTPTLVDEAIQAGSFLDEIRQAESELDTPSTPTRSDQTPIKEISKHISKHVDRTDHGSNTIGNQVHNKVQAHPRIGLVVHKDRLQALEP
jgi:hypothetical protein